MAAPKKFTLDLTMIAAVLGNQIADEVGPDVDYDLEALADGSAAGFDRFCAKYPGIHQAITSLLEPQLDVLRLELWNAWREDALAHVASLRPVTVIDTSDFERSHRLAPRGDGSWGFCSVRPGSDGYLDRVVWFQGKYGAAKRQAVSYGRANGHAVMYVCS